MDIELTEEAKKVLISMQGVKKPLVDKRSLARLQYIALQWMTQLHGTPFALTKNKNENH